MRDYRDSKAIAHSLRDALAARSVSISHSESLELVAKILGVRDWNELSAQIRSADGAAPRDTRVKLFDGLEAPILAVRDIVLFPGLVTPLYVVREHTKRAIERALAADNCLVVVAQRNPEEDTPKLADLHRVGVRVEVLDTLGLRELLPKQDGVRILVKGLERAALSGAGSVADVTARIAPVKESRADAPEAAALREGILQRIRAQPPADIDDIGLKVFAALDRPGPFADLLIAHLRLPVAEAQELLQAADVVARLEKLRAKIAALATIS